MKEVLISIQKPHTDNIKALIKKIEVRKDKPTMPTPFTVVIYETKAKGGSGKVIGEFICDKVVRWRPVRLLTNTGVKHIYILYDDELKETCLSYDEIINYGKGKTLCGWHISDLKIYDKPKELSEFYRECPQAYSSYEDGCCAEMCVFHEEGYCKQFCLPITRPPQSWCYVEVDSE